MPKLSREEGIADDWGPLTILHTYFQDLDHCHTLLEIVFGNNDNVAEPLFATRTY